MKTPCVPRRSVSRTIVYRALKHGCAIATVAVLGISSTHAADRNWNGNGADNKWSTSLNWDTGVPVNNDRVIFGSTRLTPTNDIAGLTISGIEFNAGGFALTGLSLTNSGGVNNVGGDATNNIPLVLSTAQSFTNNSGGVMQFGGTINNLGNNLSVGGSSTLNLNGVISGGGKLVIFGDGETVRLGAANTFAGGVVINNNATVLVANAGAFPSGAGILDVTNDGSINLNATSVTMNGLYGASSGLIDNASGTALYTVTVGNNSTNSGGVYNGTIQNTSGQVALTKVNTNNFTLNGASTYLGATRVNAGTLTLGASASINNSANVFISPGAAFDVSALASYPLGLSGFQSLFAGRTTNGGPNDIVGTLDVDVTGTLNIYNPGAAGTLGISGGLALQFGTVSFDLGTTTTPGAGVNDMISIHGPLTLTAATVQLNPLSGSFAAGAYTLISNSTATVIGNTNSLSVRLPRGLSAAFDATTQPGNLLLTMSGAASPATLVWAGGPGAAWDVQTSQNWKNGAAPDYFFFLDNVVFNDTATGPVQLDVGVSPGSTTFNSSATNAYTINGNGAISGTGGLTINNGASVTMNTGNSYTNATTISDGTLILGTLTSTPSGPHIAVYNGVAPANLVLGAGNVFMSDAANFTYRADFNTIVANPGGASVAMRNRQSSSSYILQINGVNRTVGGTLDFNNIQSKAASPQVGLLITNTATVNGHLGGFVTIFENDWVVPVATGAGSVAYAAYQTSTTPSTWGTTSNINLTASTAANVNSSTINALKLTGPSTVTINAAQTLTLSSGGLLVPGNAAGDSTITGGSINGGASADLIVHQYSSTRSLNIASVIADNGGATALTKAGRGTLILSGANTYSGITYNNGPTIGTLAGTTPSFFPAGTLQVGAGGTSGTLGNSTGVSNNAVLAFNRSDTVTISIPITGRGSLSQLGSGTTILTANNGYQGNTTISAGTLQVGNGGTTGSLGSTTNITDNGRINFNRSDSIAYSVPISGTGGLTKSGGGSLTLSGLNTYQAATFVNAGSLVLGANAAPSNSAAFVVAGGATLNISAIGGFTLNGGTVNQILAGTGNIVGDLATTAGVRIAPATNGVVGTLAFANSLNLNGGIVDIDISTSSKDLITVGGGLALNGGTIRLSVSGSLTNGTYRLISYSGGLSGAAANLTVTGFSQPGQIASLTAGGGGLDLVISAYIPLDLTWRGDGAGNLWDINSTANFTNNANGLPSVFHQFDNVALNDKSANPTVNLTGSLSPGIATVDSSVNNYKLQGSGNLSSGVLIKKNSSTLTVVTINSLATPVGVTGGTLQLGDGVTAGNAGSGFLTNSAAVIFQEPADTTIANTIVGSGTIDQQGPGGVVLTGDSTYNGTMTLSGGTVQVGAGGTSGLLGSGPVVNNTALIFNRLGTYAQSGGISGDGSVSNVGLGTLVLSGANSYTGVTAIVNGTLKLGAPNVIPDGLTASDVVMDGGVSTAGTLDLNGFNETINGLSGVANTFWGQVVNNSGSITNVLTVGNNDVSSSFGGQIRDNTGTGGKIALVKVGTGTLTLLPQGVGSTYSGGTILSNGIVTGGTSVTANPNFVGAGPVTFYGGTLQLAGFIGSTTPDYGVFPNALVVPAGQTATILGTCRGDFNPSSVTGSGTIIFSNRYVRCNVGGNWSAFTGTISVNPDPGGALDAHFRINSTTGFGNAKVNLAPTVFAYNRVPGNPIIYFGELTGDSTTFLRIDGGTGAAGVAAIFGMGGLNTTTNFDGTITEGVGVLKVGTGTLTLTHPAIDYTGQTIVSNGVLVFASGAGLPNSSTFSIAAPGILDISAAGTLSVGASGVQTIQGDGTLRGALSVGASGTVSPGFSIGALTVTNTALLSGTCLMELNRTNAVRTNDLLIANVSIDYANGTLTVTNTGPALHAGDTFKLFSSPSINGAFLVTNLPASDNNTTYTWTNNLAQGIIGVASAVPIVTVNTNSTNIVFSVSAGQLTLSWPADHIGWRLQAQTNTLAVGLKTPTNLWFDVTGSSTTNQIIMPIAPANGTVFFRMIYP